MARQVTCICGRRFHIGHGKAGVQCRKCGRWWSGEELSPIGVVATVLRGGELARTKKVKGNRKQSQAISHRGKQTNRRRPPLNPIGSVLRWILG